MATRQLQEVETAYRCGYPNFRTFKRAVSKGDVPPPTRYLGENSTEPVWSEDAIEAHIRGIDLQDPTEGDLLQKIEAIE